MQNPCPAETPYLVTIFLGFALSRYGPLVFATSHKKRPPALDPDPQMGRKLYPSLIQGYLESPHMALLLETSGGARTVCFFVLFFETPEREGPLGMEVH